MEPIHKYLHVLLLEPGNFFQNKISPQLIGIKIQLFQYFCGFFGSGSEWVQFLKEAVTFTQFFKFNQIEICESMVKGILHNALV